MRLDFRPTVPEVEPAFRAYSGEALRLFLDAPALGDELLNECLELALAQRDREGARLARVLCRMSVSQRGDLRRRLGAPGLRAAVR